MTTAEEMLSHCLYDVGMKLIFMAGYYMCHIIGKCFFYVIYSQASALFVLRFIIIVYIEEKMNPERLTDLLKAPQVVRSLPRTETRS